MRHHTIKLIINPNADMGCAWKLASDLRPIVDEFGGADWSSTVHEVISGLMQVPQEKCPRLGVTPLSSGNDFFHAIEIEKSPSEAQRQVRTGKPRRIDIGAIEVQT